MCYVFYVQFDECLHLIFDVIELLMCKFGNKMRARLLLTVLTLYGVAQGIRVIQKMNPRNGYKLRQNKFANFGSIFD